MIEAATDGSCLKNPGGPGGWAWYIDEARNGSAGATNTTNNTMEVTAIRELLRSVDEPLRVFVDSKYALGCLTEWAPKWRTNGWKNAKNKPVANRALIESTLELVEERIARGQLEFVHVRGHQGHVLNEAADRLAGIAAETMRGDLCIHGPGVSHCGHPDCVGAREFILKPAVM